MEVLATPTWLEGASAMPLPDVPVHQVSEAVLAVVAETDAPQGVVAVCRDVTVGLEVVLGSAPRLVAVLAEVRDPGNAGTIIRTADAAGADAVILTAASVDPLGGKCVRASAGSIFHLPIVTGQTVDVLEELRGAGLRVLVADGSAPRTLADPGLGSTLTEPTAWVLGNEAHGVPGEYARAGDASVSVPLYGRAESLNVSVAAALCLYASAEAQRAAAHADDGRHRSEH